MQQLLAVARPPATGDRSAADQVCSVNEVVTSLRDLLTRLIGENIVLRSSLDNDLGMVRMDPAHLQQILLNLVLNARDAMPDGGQITVSTRNCSDDLRQTKNEAGIESDPRLVPCIELAVSDCGCGMDAETLNRAFEPSSPPKRPDGATALDWRMPAAWPASRVASCELESRPGSGTQVSLLLPHVEPHLVSAARNLNLPASNPEKIQCNFPSPESFKRK